MSRTYRAVIAVALMAAASGVCGAAEITFAPRELFRIPFGSSREMLAARVEGNNFLVPRDFTMDGAGHFYIYDTANHRVARYSFDGKYEIGYRYSETAGRIFAHADSHQNLWLLISDPVQGMYYGVYDPQGKLLRSGIFSRFNHFRLHVDDDSTLHVILSSDQNAAAVQSYLLDEPTLLMKREHVAAPPETHHQVRKSDHVYFIDQLPDSTQEDVRHVNRITDESHRGVADIHGTVIYVTDQGDVYARMGDREIDVFGIDGSKKGKVMLSGLRAACASVRFDGDGNLYELDGIPDDKGRYDDHMTGMRVLQYQRQQAR